MREYVRRRAERDPEWAAHRVARKNERYRERLATDPIFAERRRKKQRDQRIRNPEAVHARDTQWRNKNRETINEQARERWRLSPVLRQRAKEWHHARNAALTPPQREHKRYRERENSPRYRERRRRFGILWRQRNRDHWLNQLAVSNANRQARLRNAGGSWTWAQFQDLCAIAGNRCYYCGCVPGKLTPDHAIPLARGGSNDITNLVPACLSCNKRKGTRTKDEYLARLQEKAYSV